MRARFSAPQSCWRGLPVAHPNIVDLDLDPVCGPLDECDGWPCARCGLARGAPEAGPVHQLDGEATPSRECLCTCRPTAGQWEARCGGRLQLCLSIHVVTVAIRFEITSALFRHDALVSPQSFEIGAHVAQTRRLRSHATSSPHMSGRHDTHASPRARKRCGRSRSRWRQTSRRAVRPVVAHPRTGRSLPLAMQLRLRAKVTASTPVVFKTGPRNARTEHTPSTFRVPNGAVDRDEGGAAIALRSNSQCLRTQRSSASSCTRPCNDRSGRRHESLKCALCDSELFYGRAST